MEELLTKYGFSDEGQLSDAMKNLEAFNKVGDISTINDQLTQLEEYKKIGGLNDIQEAQQQLAEFQNLMDKADTKPDVKTEDQGSLSQDGNTDIMNRIAAMENRFVEADEKKEIDAGLKQYDNALQEVIASRKDIPEQIKPLIDAALGIGNSLLDIPINDIGKITEAANQMLDSFDLENIIKDHGDSTQDVTIQQKLSQDQQKLSQDQQNQQGKLEKPVPLDIAGMFAEGAQKVNDILETQNS